ncbi:alpha/beta hydrolase [Dongshaea marina]|uniref:alpha/beta hydrolase n=1 Tax=Dongshaea marina TaxID=2047966 RepID=UPI000D3E7FD1|nr:alpha/beta hydrolase [Dongshaea marina]
MAKLTKSLLVASLFSCALLLNACGGGGGGDSSGYSKDSSSGSSTTTPGFTNKYLAVPKDYQNPNGEAVQLYYTIHKATSPSNYKGVLVFNFGGPGGEGVSTLQDKNYYNSLPSEIKANFDLVSFDPRGTGKSAFSSCSTIDGCEDTAPFMGSNTVIQDMDRLRQALGQEQISFLGYSYGTRLGSLYAAKYPEHLRALVLDSPMDPREREVINIFKDEIAGDETVAKFRLNSSEYHALKQLMSNLNSDGSYTLNSVDSLSSGDIQALLQVITTQNIEQWDYNKNDVANLLGYINNGFSAFSSTSKLKDTLSNIKTMASTGAEERTFRNVVCTDQLIGYTQPDADNAASTFASESVIFGDYVAQQLGTCADWTERKDPIAISPEIDGSLQAGPNALIIGVEKDTNTPFKWAKSMQQAFGTKASFVTVENLATHAISYIDNFSCVDNMTTQYLLNPEQPTQNMTCDYLNHSGLSLHARSIEHKQNIILPGRW